MNKVTKKLYQFIKPYLTMKIKGRVINCPYWMNKIKGNEIIRGFGNGKADAKSIKEKLEQVFDGSDLYKLAMRERVGIDCSGFVYRILNYLIPRLNEVFPGGINRTNAAMLTAKKNTILIEKIEDVAPVDLIRMRGGKHVAVIIEKNEEKIVYAHSSSERYTKEQGVHLGEIKIVDPQKDLSKQIWQEELKDGRSLQSLYFHPEKGDGVYRPKWMNS